MEIKFIKTPIHVILVYGDLKRVIPKQHADYQKAISLIESNQLDKLLSFVESQAIEEEKYVDGEFIKRKNGYFFNRRAPNVPVPEEFIKRLQQYQKVGLDIEPYIIAWTRNATMRINERFELFSNLKSRIIKTNGEIL